MVEGREWMVEGGRWRVEGGGWRVEVGGWRLEGTDSLCRHLGGTPSRSPGGEGCHFHPQ